MAIVAREQAEARKPDIIASKRVVRSHRNKLALIIDLEDTAIITAASSTAASFTAIAFASAFAVVACHTSTAIVQQLLNPLPSCLFKFFN